MPNITNTWVMAGYDSLGSSYKKLFSNIFEDSTILANKYSLNMAPGLVCYGAEIIKSSLLTRGEQLHTAATRKMKSTYDLLHVIKDQPLFIDSGGLHFHHLYLHYSRFIEDICNNSQYDDMLFFFLDLSTCGGITKEQSTRYMNEFHTKLMERTKNNEGHKRVYLVHQVNNEVVYDTFYKFITTNSIHEQLQSHKYAVGGLVPLNFNEKNKYIVRPYIISLLDIIDWELNNLKKGIPVYFHILGTSSYYEMILVAWLTILLEHYNLPLIITFDSTASINNVSRSGTLHYIDEAMANSNEYITTIETKYNSLHKPIKNRANRTNEYYFRKFKEEMISQFNLEDVPWFGNDKRWINTASNCMLIYESYSFGKVYEYIKKECESHKDWIINPNDRCYLKPLVVSILFQIDASSVAGCGRASFNNNVMDPLKTSLEYVELALQKKLPQINRSYNLVSMMCHDNMHLASSVKQICSDEEFFEGFKELQSSVN